VKPGLEDFYIIQPGNALSVIRALSGQRIIPPQLRNLSIIECAVTLNSHRIVLAVPSASKPQWHTAVQCAVKINL